MRYEWSPFTTSLTSEQKAGPHIVHFNNCYCFVQLGEYSVTSNIIQYSSIMTFIGPSAGALDAESPKSKKLKGCLVTKYALFLRICTIFCMRETTYISYGVRMRASPLGTKNAIKTKIYFWAFFPK